MAESHATVGTHFQKPFNVNVWCGVLDNQLFGSFVINVLLDVVKYFPPTFNVTHSELDFKHVGTISVGVAAAVG